MVSGLDWSTPYNTSKTLVHQWFPGWICKRHSRQQTLLIWFPESLGQHPKHSLGLNPLICFLIGVANTGGSEPVWPSTRGIFLSLWIVWYSGVKQRIYMWHSRQAFGQRCFSYCAPKQWNSPPSDIRHIQSSHVFKTVLKFTPCKQ